MKRAAVWLMLALQLVVAPMAEARVLVVNYMAGDERATGAGDLAHYQRIRNTVCGILDAFGVEYDVINSARMKTEFARTGVVTYDFGTSAARTVAYSAVIHSSIGVPKVTSWQMRTDSLLSSTKTPTVPQLMAMFATEMVASSATCCTTGVTTTSTAYDGNTYWPGVTKYLASGQSIRWRSGFLHGAVMTDAPGGVRALIRQTMNTSNAQEVLPTDGAPCMDCDSLIASPSDSVVMWTRLNSHVAGSAQVVFCNFNHLADGQMDPALLAQAVVYLDSLTGGAMIREPLRFGMLVRGGFSRGARTASGGTSPNDSTNIKASIDSLNALGVPFTVAVDMDSLNQNAAEAGWWTRASMARFTPDFALSGSWTHRSLSIALAGQFASLDSAFRGNRTDRVAVPRLGDWTPSSYSSMGFDSLGYALNTARARSLIVQQNTETPANRLPAGRYPNPYTGDDPLRVVGTAATSDSGSAQWTNGLAVDSYIGQAWGSYAEDFWRQAFNVHPVNTLTLGATFRSSTIHDDLQGQGRVRVLTISASQLGSGTRSDWATRPTRPGWWIAKSVVNASKAINSFAWQGKARVSFVPLQDVQP